MGAADRRQTAYVEAALQRAISAIAGATEGTRHETLNREAFGLGHIVGAGGLARDETVANLVQAATACGLVGGRNKPSWSNKVAAEHTVGRMVDDGAARPRELPTRSEDHDRRRWRHKTPPKPSPTKIEPAPTLHGDAVKLANEVWRIVEPLPPTSEAERWLKSRGLDVAAAWRLGCRDWRPVLDQLFAAFRNTSPEARKGMGVVDGRDDRRWWPLLDARRSHSRLFGLCIPCRTAPDGVPLKWRWRVYRPSDGEPKTLAAFGPVLPLIADGDRARIVVCEGEPDWLSIAEVVQGGAVVIGLCATSAGMPTWLWPILREARRVVVATHDAPSGKKAARVVALALIELHGEGEAECRFSRYEVKESDDCNDQHKRGALREPMAQALRLGVGSADVTVRPDCAGFEVAVELVAEYGADSAPEQALEEAQVLVDLVDRYAPGLPADANAVALAAHAGSSSSVRHYLKRCSPAGLRALSHREGWALSPDELIAEAVSHSQQETQ